MRFRGDEKPERNHAIDITRLIAIFLMFFAHVVSFFYAGQNEVVLFARNWINVVSFTTFLFISGAIIYLVYLHKLYSEEINKGKLIRRAAVLLIGYYFLAFTASFEKINNFIDTQGTEAGLKLVAKIFLLIEVPGYTEFIIPFIFFTLILTFFPKLIRKVVKNPVILLTAAFALFVLGEVLVNTLVLPSNWSELGSIFYGSTNPSIYRFPILQYSLVFLFGMYWGLIISDRKEDKMELVRQAFFMVIMLVIVVISFFIGGKDILFQRWPPSLAFLAVGITWVGLILIFVQKIPVFAKPITKLYLGIPVLKQISSNGFGIWVTHTFLLFFLTMIGFPKTSSVFLIFLEYILILIIAALINIYLVKLLKSLPAATIRNTSILIFIVTVSLILGISVLNLRDSNGSVNSGTDEVATILLPAVERPKPNYWYSEQYPYKVDISFHKVDNSDKFPTVIQKGNWVEIEINHGSFTEQKMSRTDGTDLTLLYWDGENYSPIEFSLQNLNTQDTKLAFRLYEEADLNYKNSGYSLFFGDLLDSVSDFESDYPQKPFSRIAYQVSEVGRIPFEIKVSRFWHVDGDNIAASFTIPEIVSEGDSVSYEIYPVPFTNESEAILKELVNWNPERTFALQIPLGELAYGDYYILIRINISNPDAYNFQNEAVKYLVGTPPEKISEIKSNLTGIRYSAPLYMTWTLDWEGYGLKDEYWNDMTAISERYGMPMTHLFNPRIYTSPEVSAGHAAQMTNWVKDRISKGDEVGLHLHMHYDMVQAAGLTPKTSPRWGGREEGHDVLTTAYNYDEFLQILRWSKEIFKQKGLPEPKGFRAGGWFLDLDNLRALSAAGFTYDTSGTDFKEPYGPNAEPRDWNLTPTTKPYKPSFSNQNAPYPQPLINIWEYPNNGADSTNRTSGELIRRLRLNMASEKGFLTEPQVLTYMSHPHWFGTIDKPHIIALFEESGKYKYSNDAGPVIYVTSIEAHNRYQAAISK